MISFNIERVRVAEDAEGHHGEYIHYADAMQEIKTRDEYISTLKALVLEIKASANLSLEQLTRIEAMLDVRVGGVHDGIRRSSNVIVFKRRLMPVMPLPSAPLIAPEHYTEEVP